MGASAAGVDATAAVRRVIARLRAAGIDSAEYDARELVAHVLGVPRSRLAAGPALDDEQYADLLALAERRARREPLQHLTGVAGFRYLELAVGPGVFVPRPETELVAGAAVDAASAAMRERGAALVVDLCTGSGAIALAIATEVQGSEVHAVEREEVALAWAARNVQAVAADVTLHHAAVADTPDVLSELVGRVDVVVSNPPYIPLGAAVAPEVGHDPAAALWGGADGLDTVREVVTAACDLLRQHGILIVEHDEQTSGLVVSLLEGSAGWGEVAPHADLAGRPRFVTARRLS